MQSDVHKIQRRDISGVSLGANLQHDQKMMGAMQTNIDDFIDVENPPGVDHVQRLPMFFFQV